MRSIVVAALLLLAAALLPGCAEPDRHDVLTIGLEPAYPPFESKHADGSLAGLDVDLMRALAEHVGRPVEFREMGFDALIPELQLGRIDMICSGMSWTEPRTRVVDFSTPYLQVPMGVLLSTERAGDVVGADELNRAGVILAVQRGTSGEQKAQERFPDAEIRSYDDEVTAAGEVASGRADALVYDMVSVAKHHAVHGDTTRILDEDLGVEHYCIALAKGSPLLADVDAFLAAADADGTLDEILARWLPEPDRFRVRED